MVLAYVDEQVSIRKLARIFHRAQSAVSKVIREAGVHGTLFPRVLGARRGGTYEVLISRAPGLGARPTAIQWAYIAGIFDGEGCLESRHGRFRISIAQKDHALHDYLRQTLGAGTVHQSDHCASFRLTSQKQTYEFLLGVVEHLVVKRAKVEGAIASLRARYACLRGAA